MKVSDYVTQYLEEQLQCRAVFLLSGGGMMHLLDSLGRCQKLRYYCQHHEQACFMAADAYARKSGQLGVCFTTSGPGATNTLTGLVGAWQDSSPVLLISGQCKRSQTMLGTQQLQLRQLGMFEVNMIPIVQSITKYCAWVESAESLPYHLEKACHLALSGRPGPSFLEIPLDIQGAQLPQNTHHYLADNSELFPTKKDLHSLDLKLNCAKKPILLAGHGIQCAQQKEAFLNVIEQLNIPVTTTPLATDLITYDHPLFVGHPGLKGDRAGNLAIQQSDLLIILGSSLHVSTIGYHPEEFAPHATKILINLDPAVLNQNQCPIQLKIHAGVKETLQMLQQNTYFQFQTSTWHHYCQKLKQDLAVSKEIFSTPPEKIHYYDLIHALSDLTEGHETLISDAGSGYYVLGQAYRIKKNQRILSSGSLGAMGFALPATTGAWIADPHSQVICITGDGSLQTNIHELATLRYHQMDAKLLIVNNQGYASIRNTQQTFFNSHYVGTDATTGIYFPHLKNIAQAYEMPYFLITWKTELHEILKTVLKTPGPVLCEILTPPHQEIHPSLHSRLLPDGTLQTQSLSSMHPFLDYPIFSEE